VIAQRVAAGEAPAAVARAFGVCDRTVHKWVARATEGRLALEDRSCRPHRSPRAISAALMVEIERARQRRWTGAVIAEVVGLSRATVARTLGQLGLARLPAVETPKLSPRAGATSGSGRANCCTLTSRSGAHRRHRSSHHRGPAPARAGHRLGVRARLHR